MKLDLDKTYQDIFSYQRQYSITFLENHCASLASLLVIGKRFGERKILSEETDLNYFMLVDSCLSAIYPDNKYLAEFKKRIGVFSEKQKINEMTEKRLAIGNKVPDISMKDPSGKKVSLYSLQGRPVIIYFWASWNEDSRNANVRMKELLEKSGRDKPAVYAIGLETYKESWTDAINKDGTGNWIHVSDFLNIHSSAKSLFNAPDNLPYFILLDKELIIRYKGNDFGVLGAEISRVKQ
jgi:thiol-disulfide isomerase/thioredoxin